MQRQWHLDVMRIVSMAAVVLLHTAGQYWSRTDVTSFDWGAMNFYDSMVRWAVPVFVMISGALFLDPNRDVTLRKIWTKSIPRIAIIILIWGFVYALIYNPPTEMTVKGIWAFCKVWVLGHFHMRFLFMILGLYAVTPILRCVTRDGMATKYFLGLAFVVCVLLPFITSFGHLSIVSKVVDKVEFQVVGGYAFYFVLGYWLNSMEMSGRMRRGAICAGIVGLLLTFVLTEAISLEAGKPLSTYYGNFSFPVCLAAVGVFVCLKSVRIEGERTRGLVRALSSASLGVYLVHAFVLDSLKGVGIDSVMFSSAAAIPATALVVIVVSFGVAVLLRRIPVIGTWIV